MKTILEYYVKLEFKVRYVSISKQCFILVGFLVVLRLNPVSEKSIIYHIEYCHQWKTNYTVHYLTLKYGKSFINDIFTIKFRILQSSKIWHRWICGFAHIWCCYTHLWHLALKQNNFPNSPSLCLSQNHIISFSCSFSSLWFCIYFWNVLKTCEWFCYGRILSMYTVLSLGKSLLYISDCLPDEV